MRFFNLHVLKPIDAITSIETLSHDAYSNFLSYQWPTIEDNLSHLFFFVADVSNSDPSTDCRQLAMQTLFLLDQVFKRHFDTSR